LAFILLYSSIISITVPEPNEVWFQTLVSTLDMQALIHTTAAPSTVRVAASDQCARETVVSPLQDQVF